MFLSLLVFTPTMSSNCLAEHRFLVEIISVTDGDTVKGRIDVGFDIQLKANIRFYKFDAYESNRRRFGKKNTTERELKLGKGATKYLNSLLKNKKVYLTVPKRTRGKYGRVLGTLWVDGKSVSKLMEKYSRDQ